MAVVLVVNDDAEMLATYESLLLSMGHQPVTKMAVDSGPETLRSIGADALLVDLQSGDEDEFGIRVIEEVRADPGVRDVPIILCTGAAESVKPLIGRLQALKVPVVLKPFAVSELEGALRRILEQQEGGP